MVWLASQFVTPVNDAQRFSLGINSFFFNILYLLGKIVLHKNFKHNIELKLQEVVSM